MKAVKQGIGYGLSILRFAYVFGMANSLQFHLPGRLAVLRDVPGIAHPIYLRKCFGDKQTFHEVFIHRVYDHRWLNGLTPKLIIDAGAHIGLTSIFFANRFPKAKIISIEPNSSNFAVLLSNARPYPNIFPVNAALWHREATVRIANPEDDTWTFSCLEGGDISALPIASFTNGSVPDIIKIDVEGAEKDIFEHSAIPRPKLLFIETHDRLVPGCSQQVLSYICRSPFNRDVVGNMDVVQFY